MNNNESPSSVESNISGGIRIDRRLSILIPNKSVGPGRAPKKVNLNSTITRPLRSLQRSLVQFSDVKDEVTKVVTSDRDDFGAVVE